MYRPAEIRCRLHTGGKSVEDFRERYRGQGLTWRNFESLKKAFDLFDGREINLYKYGEGVCAVYYVAWWPKVDAKIMEAVYQAEQTHPRPAYAGQWEKFVQDWGAGKYDAGMGFSFPAEDVEELEVVREELDLPEPEPEPVPELPKWRRIRDKRKRRKK